MLATQEWSSYCLPILHGLPRAIGTHAAHVLFHLNLATIMSDLWSSIPLSLCFCASTVLCYISVYGWASISNEFMMTLGEQHGALEVSAWGGLAGCARSTQDSTHRDGDIECIGLTVVHQTRSRTSTENDGEHAKHPEARLQP